MGSDGFVFGRFHSLECHNYHIKTWKRCPYCATGSKPVPKCVIVERVNK